MRGLVWRAVNRGLLRPVDHLIDRVLRLGWEWPAFWLGWIAISRGVTFLSTEERAPYALSKYLPGGVAVYAALWLVSGAVAIFCATTHWRPQVGHWSLFAMCEVWASVYLASILLGGGGQNVTGAILFGFLGFVAYCAPPIRYIFVPIVPTPTIPPEVLPRG